MSGLWGIDLGGTKIEGAVLSDPAKTDTLCRLRVPTEAGKGYEHVLAQIEALVRSMEDVAGPRPPCIGIGTPGVTDSVTGALKNSNTGALIGKPLLRDLQNRLGVEVRMANDANCFALAEARLGAGRGAATVFGVILGTGVGGGIVVGGQVLNGAQGIAGEWGHNVLDPAGEKCYCGKTGCVETVLSGPFLERYYEKLAGVRLPLAEVVSRARGGEDAHAQQTLERLTSRFGEALSVVVNILDPDVVILGGGVGNIDELYTSGLAALRKWAFVDHLFTRIERPILGDSAGVFGAAFLTCDPG